MFGEDHIDGGVATEAGGLRVPGTRSPRDGVVGDRRRARRSGATGRRDYGFEVQRQILRVQRALRKHFLEMAQLYSEPVVILYDRGEMDNAAYIDRELFMMLLEEEGLDLWAVRDSYDFIVHLVSAAKGAPEAYSLANNSARSESIEAARALDGTTLASWTGHPRLRVIENTAKFEEKADRVLKSVAQVLGEAGPLEIERKFLLKEAPDMTELGSRYAVVKVEIEQSYIVSANEGVETRVRRRSQGEQHAYFWSEKETKGPGAYYDREREITARNHTGGRGIVSLRRSLLRVGSHQRSARSVDT